MEIYEALKQDHEEVKALLNELLSLDDDDEYRYVLMEQIRNELIPHARAEESVFYNTIRAVNADKSVVMHGYKEHMEAETLLRTLLAKDKINLNWRSTAEKLKEALDHHIEEEESRIFAEARKIFSSEEATQLGEAFEELKPKVAEEGFIKTSFDLMVNLLPPRLSNSIKSFGSNKNDL